VLFDCFVLIASLAKKTKQSHISKLTRSTWKKKSSELYLTNLLAVGNDTMKPIFFKILSFLDCCHQF